MKVMVKNALKGISVAVVMAASSVSFAQEGEKTSSGAAWFSTVQDEKFLPADINTKLNEVGFTHLMMAASSGNVEIVQLILDAGADVHALTGNNNNAAFYVSGESSGEILRLFAERGMNLYQIDKDGDSIMTQFAYDGNLHALQGALDLGMHPDYSGKPSSPLLVALNSSEQAAALLLLKAGASVHARDNHGRTPLFCSLSYGDTELTSLILEKMETQTEPLRQTP